MSLARSSAFDRALQRDHIGWHFDHNFYRGRHFTVLLCLMNEDRVHGGLSSAHLQARIDGVEEITPTPPNTLVVFEGAHVLHSVTGLGPEQTRIQLSMTFCTDPSALWFKSVIRRIKDTAYFGVRALWRRHDFECCVKAILQGAQTTGLRTTGSCCDVAQN